MVFSATLSIQTPVTNALTDKARNRAEKALRGGEFETAEKLFREAVAKNPKDIAARLGLSHSYEDSFLSV